MWDRSRRALWLALWCGLCAAASANTTAAEATLPRNDSAPPVRMALLLPLNSATLGAAAAALRDGALAAYRREPAGVTLDVLESGEGPAQLLPAYAEAIGKFDLVIGPLSRSEVAAVARSGNVIRPTIALAQPDGGEADEQPPLPPRLLAIGLSLEDEARQVADWIGAEQPGGKVFVLATASAWQQRSARAFAAQAPTAGLDARRMELGLANGALSPSGLAQLRQRIAAEQPQALFVALDAGQARQLRSAIGDQVPLYGTSQLNPLTPADWARAEPVDALNGARLVDIPWLLQPDDPAVMAYPHPVVAADQERSADLERLYALGIDAYRVAREIAAGGSGFALDGVTGRLAVSFGGGPAGFIRREPRALYRDGRVQPLADGGQ